MKRKFEIIKPVRTPVPSSPDQDRSYIYKLRNDIKSIRTQLRELNGTLHGIQVEFDMLVRMLRAVKVLRKNDYERLRNLLESKYKLVDDHGGYRGRIMVTKYGCLPTVKKDGNNPV